MIGFLVALLFTPALVGMTWMLTSPRLDGYAPWKVIIKILLAVAILGGMLAQLNFLAHNVPSNTRQFYLLTLLVIDAIPMLFIMISRDPSRRRSKSANRTFSGATSKPEVNSHSPDRNDKIDILQDANGVLRVVIPPRRNLDSFRYAVAVAACGVAVILALQFALTHAIQGQRSLDMTKFLRVVQVTNVLAVAYLLAGIFTGKWILTVTPATIQIQYVLLGLVLSQKSFEKTAIKNIRYEQWEMQSRNGIVERRGIRFDAGSKTYSFGHSITDPQAHELIERMTAV
jgi:peptidoglycan biosynthesis protein MviN/MurJ (putative lipid II flippase)